MKQELFLAATMAFALIGFDWSEAGVPYHRILNQEGKLPGNASLQLATSISEQDYCTNGEVRVFLRLRYTNTGNEPILLRKYSFAITRYTVSRSLEAASKEHYEILARFHYPSVVQPNPTRGRAPSTDRFVILPPGDSYEIDTKALYSKLHIDSSLGIGKSSGGRLSKGNHVLQISVSTWDEPVVLAEELTVAWRKYGVLWWRGVTSQPMPFKIEKPTSTVKCS